MLDEQLENLFEQYKIFKKNLDLQFLLHERQELKGLLDLYYENFGRPF